MESNDARWDLLPHDPLGFFGLKEGFDRKELKRSYGKLIRIYKPESHPREFQRIREVYEELESENRYGAQVQLSGQRLNAWETRNEDERPAPFQVESANPSPRDLAVEDPTAAYKQLVAKPKKSPQDFFTIAILSDLVDSSDPQRFLKWLMTGLKQYPDDPGLSRLLREYLSSDVDPNQASSVLLTLSKLVAGDAFFPLTEPLWDRLLRDFPFEKFAKLLDACESNLKQGGLQSRLVFYVHILRPAIWRSDLDWFLKRWNFIQRHGTELPSGLDQDVEFLSLLSDYFQKDRSKSEGDPIRKQIDGMLRSYCEDPSWESTAKVASVQSEIARNSLAFMEAFPADDAEADHRVLSLCAMVAYDVVDQTELGYTEVMDGKLSHHADQVVVDLRVASEQVWSSITWIRWRGHLIAYSLLVVLPMVLLWGWIPPGTMFWIAVAWIAIGTLSHFALVKPFFLEKTLTTKIQKKATGAYEQVWRPRLFRYVQSCHASPRDAMETLAKSAYHVGESNVINVILSYANADLGLRVFHLSQQFLH